jgi:hypothetical protein
MKECSICHTQYEDSNSFCSKDGSQLKEIQIGRPIYSASAASTGYNPLAQEISFLANYFMGLNAVGGKLHINETTAVFKAHRLNLGGLREKVIPLADITGYSKGVLTILNVYLRNGEKIKFAVYNRDNIINALEVRRQAYYQKLGQQAPPLTTF